MNGRSTGGDRSGSPQVGALEPGRVLSGIILLLGLAILGWGSYAYVQDTSMPDQRVEVTAEVTSVGVEQVPALRSEARYVPRATFDYSFQEVDYSSDNVFPGSSAPRYQHRETAEAQLAAVSVGDTVAAYVDPSAPDQAFLVDSRSGQATRYLAFGALLALIGGLRQLQLWAQPPEWLQKA
jgi:Protein of unknown function (DUF3592).